MGGRDCWQSSASAHRLFVAEGVTANRLTAPFYIASVGYPRTTASSAQSTTSTHILSDEFRGLRRSRSFQLSAVSTNTTTPSATTSKTRDLRASPTSSAQSRKLTSSGLHAGGLVAARGQHHGRAHLRSIERHQPFAGAQARLGRREMARAQPHFPEETSLGERCRATVSAGRRVGRPTCVATTVAHIVFGHSPGAHCRYACRGISGSSALHIARVSQPRRDFLEDDARLEEELRHDQMESASRGDAFLEVAGGTRAREPFKKRNICGEDGVLAEIQQYTGHLDLHWTCVFSARPANSSGHEAMVTDPCWGEFRVRLLGRNPCSPPVAHCGVAKHRQAAC